MLFVKILYPRITAENRGFRNSRASSKRASALSRDSQIISRNAKVFVRVRVKERGEEGGRDYISRRAELNFEMISRSIPPFPNGTTILPE